MQPSQKSYTDQYNALLQAGVAEGKDRDRADRDARKALGLKETV